MHGVRRPAAAALQGSEIRCQHRRGALGNRLNAMAVTGGAVKIQRQAGNGQIEHGLLPSLFADIRIAIIDAIQGVAGFGTGAVAEQRGMSFAVRARISSTVSVRPKAALSSRRVSRICDALSPSAFARSAPPTAKS